MFEKKKKLELNSEELRIIAHSLNDFRNHLLSEDNLVDPINEVLTKLKSKMKVTKSNLGVMINSLDYSRKVMINNNQDTLEIDNLILKLVDIYEILEK